MKRTVIIDPFFENQPPMEFIEQLKQPLHSQKPVSYGQRDKQPGEVDVRGMYLAEKYPNDPEDLLDTIYRDFEHFLDLYTLAGDTCPVYLRYDQTPCFEAYRVKVGPGKVTITAADTEGIRRGLVYLEDMLRRKEAGFLDPGEVQRSPKIKSRITRCFFSPINRPPKFGDELTDDVDYYPEEYLNRLMHDGTNGVWIYTRFSDLLPSKFLSENGKGGEARIAKLNRVVEKCRRYGIGVYVFAIEPYHLLPDQAKQHPDMAGVRFDRNGGKSATMCMCSSESRDYCFEQGRALALAVPNLRGFISITEGERPTSCVSVHPRWSHGYEPCPRCGEKKRGQLLAMAAEALASGFRSVNPDIEVVSWSYGHRLWEYEEICDYVEAAPDDVCVMQNFDDMGIANQLGKDRMGMDYWLSYAGPSDMFRVTAQKARDYGKRLFAKMQVCCSHEIASVPYIPTPGLVFEKYKGAVAYGVEGIMQCWYFGNYPSIMSKAAGELSFMDDFSDKHGFLKDLAAIYQGQSRAEAVAQAFEAFERGYGNYPLNIMFSYYGPAHDGVVWELALKPKNFSLPRSWLTTDPADGDRICESLLTGHTLPEAKALFEEVCNGWREGLTVLRSIPADSEDARELRSVAECIGLLFESTNNILEFYLLREALGYGTLPAMDTLQKMQALVEAEIANSSAMIPLCQQDARLGYHSEGEGYKFFPEKLRCRIEKLQALLGTEFSEVERRIRDGLSPLAYYQGEEEGVELPRVVMSRTGIEDAAWQTIDESHGSRFRISCAEDCLMLELESACREDFMLCPEYALMHPEANVIFTPEGKADLEFVAATIYYELVGVRREQELEKYKDIQVLPGYGTHLLVNIRLQDFGIERVRPWKLRILAGDISWIQDETEISTLGKAQIRPAEYGWIL